MISRDVARSLKDGSLHRLTIPLGPHSLIFDTDTVPTDRGVISGRLAVDGRGVRYAIAAGAESGSVLVRDDGQLTPFAVGGRFFAAIRPLAVGVEVYIQGTNEDGQNTTISVYDEQGALLRTFRAHYGSMGILSITGPTSIASSADAIVSAHGRTWWSTYTIDGWRVGQIEYSPPGAPDPSAGTVGLAAPDGSTFAAQITPAWNGYTNMPSYLAVGETAVFVAIPDAAPGWAPPEPDAITWIPLGHSRTVAELLTVHRPIAAIASAPIGAVVGNGPDPILLGLAVGVVGALWWVNRT